MNCSDYLYNDVMVCWAFIVGMVEEMGGYFRKLRSADYM
jgi:hypothetical protein